MHAPVEIEITAPGPDKGKVFVLTRMPALQAEDWIMRAALGMMRGGVTISQDQLDQGFAALGSVLLSQFGKIPIEEARALRYEMLPFIERKLTGEHGVVKVRALNEVTIPRQPESYDVEQPSTWFALRWAYLKIYEDFFRAAAPLLLGWWAVAKNLQAQSAPPTSPASSPLPSEGT